MTATPAIWLVPHDFSTCADAAADLAFDELADSRRGGRLVLLHVYTVLLPPASIEGAPLAPGFIELERAAMEESTKRLERVAQRLRERVKENGPTVEVRARIGTPAEVILAEAGSCGATRIVVGTHGRTGVTHLLLGSVAERVVRRATVPVLVAHAAKKGAAS